MNESARNTEQKITPFPFQSFPFTVIKIAAFQLVTLAFTLLGYAQVGAMAFPRMAAEFMGFLRGSGLLPMNKN